MVWRGRRCSSVPGTTPAGLVCGYYGERDSVEGVLHVHPIHRKHGQNLPHPAVDPPAAPTALGPETKTVKHNTQS